MSKINRILAKDWDELVNSIPDDLEASAREHGALRRRRGIKSAANLLRLLLIFATVLSLLTTALWGVGLGICDISRQAIQKRVHKSTPWLRYLLTVLLGTLVEMPADSVGLIRRVILRDASVISRPSSPGTEWRIHLSWSPFSMQPTQVTMTDARAGEGLQDAGLQAGDLVVADRAHGIWRTIQVALQALAYFIIRLTWSNLPLLTPNGPPFELIAWLRGLPATENYAQVTVIAADDSEKRPLRLVVGRLPPDKAAEARERARRQARKNKRQVSPNTLLAAGFCILLTNLPGATWSNLSILAFYRVRWQVEWCFRRWKSLCRLDELPAYPAKIAEPVLLAKLIIILLMQRRLGVLPWSNWWATEEPAPVVSPVVKMVYKHLCEIICPAAVIDQLLENPTPFLRHLRSSRRKRPLQLAAAARCFAGLLTDLNPVPTLC
ncbi:MAG: transposase [Anaerolineae bacterium]|nr:transposase [Anaerolineae bacterium]